MQEIVFNTVFMISLAALLYIYAGYPLLVCLVARIFPKPIKRAHFAPKVSVIITAYNEEQDIRAKIENTLMIDYPQEKLEIIIASDGSTDKTDLIVGEFAAQNVILFRQEGRVGKTFTQNKAVERATGEIILFSDATTMYQSNVLRAILPNFADESVGCVAGKLIYVDGAGSGIGTGAKGYWTYETFLKECESRACSLIGASGCLYSVRKSAYQPMYPEACSDFLIATLIYKQGLRTVYEPDAICTEETNRESKKEMRMRVRIISQTFTDLWRNREMLNPARSGFFAIELISHKVLRYSVPFFLILMAVAAGGGAFSSKFFLVIFALQILFYATALLAWILEKAELNPGILVVPYYFVIANLAAAVGLYKFLRGERYARWEPIREIKLK